MEYKSYGFGSDAWTDGYRNDEWWAEFNRIQQFFLRVFFGYKRIPDSSTDKESI